jgi:hypothetical protein
VPVSSFDSVGKSQARSQSVTGTYVDSGVPLITITMTFGPRYMWSKRKVTVLDQGSDRGVAPNLRHFPFDDGCARWVE